jgi:hypothetical protein
MTVADRVDEAIRGYAVPAPPEGLAQAVARRIADGESARPPQRRRLRRALVGAALLATGAAVAIIVAALAPAAEEPIGAGERTATERETIALGKRAILVAEAGAALRWRPGPERAVTVEQSGGSVFYRVESGPFVVQTPRGTVHVRGTCFRVEVPDMKINRQAVVGAGVGAALASAVLVTVYEGRVSLASAEGRVDVAAGEAGALPPEGKPPRLLTPPDPAATPTPARPAPGPAAAPPPAPATAPAGREVEALRARVAEQDKEIARLREGQTSKPASRDLRSLIEPTREELLARAQRCEVAYNYPNLDAPEPTKVGDGLAKRLGLSDTEREAVDEVMRELHAQVPADLRKLYAEMSGDAATAARLSPAALLSEIFQKAPEETMSEARIQLSRERAGLAPPPARPGAGPVVERALRLMMGLGDDLERRLGERLGPERARALRGLRESWRSTSSWSGCGSR